ncbi:hypothetical protein [Conexibacter woesei]|uniref:Uncharacterized protein n=1 Tax=Conexibacter woesei (strain DSM 14684 / CCUG 47730 / CIP 108061 / JCM 11494 / NBRC 100937 / ID131577) TaxID=469383 RepID=D3F3Y0_CONWI|nr:hypothetical protein [Conexibacter woesei]ADB48463.1 hypothetical protein Cwoe_0027 [Conexibacter woesei DSM 14684]
MQPIAVDALLLRSAAPDLVLSAGRSLAARVLERGPHGVGILNLAGAIVTAELPEHVQPGDRLRLIVRETTSERVLLQIAPQQQAATPGLVPPAPGDVRLPGGGHVAVVEREGGGGAGSDEASGAVTLRLELPALGAVELRVALDAGGVRARAALAAGLPLELGGKRAAELRAALVRAAGRPAEVAVVPRRDPLDVYA